MTVSLSWATEKPGQARRAAWRLVAVPNRVRDEDLPSLPGRRAGSVPEGRRFQGNTLSPGMAEGLARVVLAPEEGERLLPGEILVARATDPGWTPLFLNAEGIILEIGGILQHGALVAREYCKPCVAGIENATSILQDGQVVELDGSNGVIRLA